MKYVTTKRMKQFDRIAIEHYGIPSLILMENAGRGTADLAEKILSKMGRGRNHDLSPFFSKRRKNRKRGTDYSLSPFLERKILVVCGKGNNGGDGFVSARHLFNQGYQVQVILLARPSKLKDDPKINFNILKKMRVPIKIVTTTRRGGFQTRPYEKMARWIQDSDLIIDGIFGVGLTRPVHGLFYDVISLMNQSKKPILSIDVPSGLNSDNGKIMGIAIKARYTATLGCAKKGLYLNEGPKCAGAVEVLDISIPRKCLNS